MCLDFYLHLQFQSVHSFNNQSISLIYSHTSSINNESSILSPYMIWCIDILVAHLWGICSNFHRRQKVNFTKFKVKWLNWLGDQHRGWVFTDERLETPCFKDRQLQAALSAKAELEVGSHVFSFFLWPYPKDINSLHTFMAYNPMHIMRIELHPCFPLHS